MNDKQKAFCEYFAECGNAAEAARRAGYSEKTARAQVCRLLTDADILQYVRRLQDQAAEIRIASLTQVKAVWSDILRDPEAKDSDRIRAGEALARAAGGFVHIRKTEDDEWAAAVEGDGGDVLIYLPALDHEAEEHRKAQEG